MPSLPIPVWILAPCPLAGTAPVPLAFWDAVTGWVRAHAGLLVAVGAGSAVACVVGILLIPVVLARVPADAFLPGRPVAKRLRQRHPALVVLLFIAKNALGGALVLLGIALLLLPGQGILTILLGLGMLDFPGKRKLVLRVVERPTVRRILDWARRRADRPPFRYPDSAESSPDTASSTKGPGHEHDDDAA